MSRLNETEELIVLQSSDIQLLVHRIPAHIGAEVMISAPPTRRGNSALKFFLNRPGNPGDPAV
jgi:hypothetical protein